MLTQPNNVHFFLVRTRTIRSFQDVVRTDCLWRRRIYVTRFLSPNVCAGAARKNEWIIACTLSYTLCSFVPTCTSRVNISPYAVGVNNIRMSQISQALVLVPQIVQGDTFVRFGQVISYSLRHDVPSAVLAREHRAERAVGDKLRRRGRESKVDGRTAATHVQYCRLAKRKTSVDSCSRGRLQHDECYDCSL